MDEQSPSSIRDSFAASSASTLALGLVLALAGAPASAVVDLSSAIYHLKISKEDLNEIDTLLPESRVNSAFINSAIDPNIRLLQDAEISVTFIDEGAGYRNSFGYFLYDDEREILKMGTIFANASEAGGGGKLRPGDTLSLGSFAAGTNLGFWLRANGYDDPRGYTYYTLDQYNPDGLRHVAMIADVVNERLVLGIEDLYNLGDKDFNDIVFTFAATPFSAIDIRGLPTGAPEAGPVATAMILATTFGAFLRKRRRKSEA